MRRTMYLEDIVLGRPQKNNVFCIEFRVIE